MTIQKHFIHELKLTSKYIERVHEMSSMINEIETRYNQFNWSFDLEPHPDGIIVRGICNPLMYAEMKDRLSLQGVILNSFDVDSYTSYGKVVSFAFEYRDKPSPIPTNSPVERRMRENEILIEIKRLSDLLGQDTPVKPFSYIPISPFEEQYVGHNQDHEMSEFTKWYNTAVLCLETLKKRVEKIKSTLKNEEMEDTSMSLGESLDYIGMPRDSIPSKKVREEIHRRLKINTNRGNANTIEKVKNTLRRYGFIKKKRRMGITSQYANWKRRIHLHK
jgi:hypothetical protein